MCCSCMLFFFSSRRRHTRFDCDWSSDVCSSDLETDGEILGLQGCHSRTAYSVCSLPLKGGGLGWGSEDEPHPARFARRPPLFRSEERRVGKECRSRWSPYH